MNPDLTLLQPYPFEKLKVLLAGLPAPDEPAIALSIGEPKHEPYREALQALRDHEAGYARYPGTRGLPDLREAIADWFGKRFGIAAVADFADHHVLPLNGTREGLFAIAQCLLDRTVAARDVLMPNPFYQIYEGATLLAGCRPAFYAIDEDADGNLDAISDERWDRCQMIYICSPGNPTGAVLSETALQRLIKRAHQHDFVIVSDECYGEIYRESAGAPAGLLQAAKNAGYSDYARCLSFHSLSKRSNLPGLRSGFVAGDATLIEKFLLYRTYHGSSMPEPVQHASITAWSDERHVAENRRLYDAKYAAFAARLDGLLSVDVPPGGFYLWPDVGVDDAVFTRELFHDQHVRVVPGSYLSREHEGRSPGFQRVRMALVAPLDECVTAADRIARYLTTATQQAVS